VGFALSIYRYIKRLYYIKNFKEYVSVLEYYMDRAYDIVHKDKILAFSLDAYRVPEEEIGDISKEFVKLVRKYIGPTLLKEFVQLYGDEDTFIFIALEYFGRRYEEDEIRKTAMDNLTQEE
jgi:hypothetical protein